MSAIQIYGPYNRASNLSKALSECRYWARMAAAVAAIFVVWFVL